jgi:hypothetical protein
MWLRYAYRVGGFNAGVNDISTAALTSGVVVSVSG